MLTRIIIISFLALSLISCGSRPKPNSSSGASNPSSTTAAARAPAVPSRREPSGQVSPDNASLSRSSVVPSAVLKPETCTLATPVTPADSFPPKPLNPPEAKRSATKLPVAPPESSPSQTSQAEPSVDDETDAGRIAAAREIMTRYRRAVLNKDRKSALKCVSYDHPDKLLTDMDRAANQMACYTIGDGRIGDSPNTVIMFWVQDKDAITKNPAGPATKMARLGLQVVPIVLRKTDAGWTIDIAASIRKAARASAAAVVSGSRSDNDTGSYERYCE